MGRRVQRDWNKRLDGGGEGWTADTKKVWNPKAYLSKNPKSRV